MRPLILVTNDDGVQAPGLWALVECIKNLGDVIVVAPAEPQSGKSAAITVSTPLRAIPLPERSGAKVYAVTGTPVDCVKLALHTIVPRKPDYVFSGTNHGSNAGTAVTYSGTMGAVMEGCMNGIPSVGFSLLHHSQQADFSLSAPLVSEIAAKVVEHGLPQWTCLNVNIPSQQVPKGVRVCRAARGYWTDEYEDYTDPFGMPFYMLTGHFVNAEPESTDTDEYWLAQGYISVVPTTPDQTDMAQIEPLSPLYNK